MSQKLLTDKLKEWEFGFHNLIVYGDASIILNVIKIHHCV